MRMHAYHGVLAQEKVVGNCYSLNLTVGYPWLAAADTDDVSDTLNYADLACVVEEQMNIHSDLLEHVALRIVNAIRSRYPRVTSIDLDIRKVDPPISQDTDGCGVRIRI